MKKRGNLLTENLIFIILNLVFISIMLLFLFSKLSGTAILEEQYSKEIALVIDSAELDLTLIELNFQDIVKEAEKNGISKDQIISFQKNLVTVKLHEGKGYSYSFFNNIPIIRYDLNEEGVLTLLLGKSNE